MKAIECQPTLMLGQQTFDGLGRQLTVVVGGRITEYEYVAAQLPPSANVLPDGKRIDYTYEPQLDHQILSIAPVGEAANTFTFDKRLALPESSSGPLGTQRMTYTPSGQLKTDTWSVDGQSYVSTWRHALGGLLLGFDDADGVAHERRYDAWGRLDQVKAGDVTQELAYDDFDRPNASSLLDPKSGNRLEQTLTYDAMGREHTRTFVITQAGQARTVVQTLEYSALDQLTLRQWQDGNEVGEETFDYDVLGRLIIYTANATAAPTDPFGNKVTRQTFELNVLDGYQKVVSTFADGSVDTASFIYADDDPTQISCINHTHPAWPAHIKLAYDPGGRVTRYSFPASERFPTLDRTLSWDAQDRLIKVDDTTGTCEYRYDPSGNLTDRVLDGALTRSFFSGSQPTHEQTGDKTLRLHAGFALSTLASGVHQGTTLLGTDAQGSVRIEADDNVRTRLYTVHGAESANDENGPYGFAGERREELTGWYIPSGYRPYDPIVMGFLSPDSDSPFGQGGLNPYAYCSGDPVNRIDPSGHGWLTWLVAGIGIGLAVIGTVASFGAAAPAFAALAGGGLSALTASGAMAIGAATLSAISLGTGIASTALEATNKDSKAASILGWVSMGTGLVGTGLEMGAARVASAAGKTQRLAGRGTTKLSKSGRASGSGNAVAPSPVNNAGKFDILYEATPGSNDVVFHENIWGRQIAAFETHGNRWGSLMDSSGKMKSASKVALNDIAPRLNTLNYPAGKPIILLACSGGKSGAAQKVANTLRRPVQGYQRTIHVDPPSGMGLLRRTNSSSNIPLQRMSMWDRLWKQKLFQGKASKYLEPAESRMYYP